MSKNNLILIGGGGHCKSCIDVIEQENKFNITGILDVKEKVINAINVLIIFVGCNATPANITGSATRTFFK